jgi:hypothetical protein
MIEGMWSGIKTKVSKARRTAEFMPEELLMYMWNNQNLEDVWGGVMRCLKTVAFPVDEDVDDENDGNGQRLSLFTEALYVPNDGEEDDEHDSDEDRKFNKIVLHTFFYYVDMLT